MPLPRIIPKRVFQLVSLPLLLAAWVTGAQLVWADLPPASWLVALAGPVLGTLLVWLGVTVAWIVVVLPFRLVTDFPTLRETLDAAGVDNAWELVGAARERHRNTVAHGTPAERRKLLVFQAAVALGLGVVLAVLTVVNLAADTDTLFLAPPVGCVVCAVMAPGYLVRAALVR